MLFGWAIPVVVYSATRLCEVSYKANSHGGTYVFLIFQPETASPSISHLHNFCFETSCIQEKCYKRNVLLISLAPLRFFTSIAKINVVLMHYRASEQT